MAPNGRLDRRHPFKGVTYEIGTALSGTRRGVYRAALGAYILDRIAVRGVVDAVGYPEDPKPQSPWARRLMKAHTNAVENLVVFATLVLVANMAGVASAAIGTAAAVYFWARVVHAVSYTLAIPWVRTLSFTVGFFAQAVVAWQILVR